MYECMIISTEYYINISFEFLHVLLRRFGLHSLDIVNYE